MMGCLLIDNLYQLTRCLLIGELLCVCVFAGHSDHSDDADEQRRAARDERHRPRHVQPRAAGKHGRLFSVVFPRAI